MKITPSSSIPYFSEEHSLILNDLKELKELLEKKRKNSIRSSKSSKNHSRD